MLGSEYIHGPFKRERRHRRGPLRRRRPELDSRVLLAVTVACFLATAIGFGLALGQVSP